MNPYVIKIINSILSGMLITFGAMLDGDVSLKTVYFSVLAGLLVATKQFQDDFKRLTEKKTVVTETVTTTTKQPPKVNLFQFI